MEATASAKGARRTGNISGNSPRGWEGAWRVTDQEIIDALTNMACSRYRVGSGDDRNAARAAAERIRVLGEKNTALLAVADAAKKVVKHTADFDLETALARLDGEVG